MEKNRQGLLHIYCGDGKGKTSAAVGMAVRAAGCGMKVLVIRFLKTENSGEVEVLRSIPGITVPPCERTFGFVFRMTEEQKQEAALYYQSRFEAAAKEAVQGQYDLLILDDCGTEVSNTFTVSRLFQLLNERALLRKSTIISTNLSIREFRDVYSERIFSRITSSYTLLKLTGSDIRIRRKINRTL